MLNQVKTVLFLGLLSGLFLAVGFFLGGNTGMTYALVLALIMNVGTFWFSDKLIIKMYRGQEIQQHNHHLLYTTVKECAEAAQVPMPRVYVLPFNTPNAFATGRNPRHAAVAATKGLLNLLDKKELKGVIAHEIAHIKNRDTLISTIAATLAAVISYIALFVRFSALFGGYGRDRDQGNMLTLLVLSILTPLMAMLIQFAISRSREFLADETAAKTIRDTEGLAVALEKLEQGVEHYPMRDGSEATASLFIVNPFRRSNIAKWLSTHPPTQERIKRLRSLQL